MEFAKFWPKHLSWYKLVSSFHSLDPVSYYLIGFDEVQTMTLHLLLTLAFSCGITIYICE